METRQDKIMNGVIKILSRKCVSAWTVLINRNGSAKQSKACPNCGPWIRHWERLSGEDVPSAGDCAAVGCNGKTKEGKPAEIEGCHVMIKGSDDRRVFIAPLCKCCNNAEEDAELVLSRPLTLVWANVQGTCGKLVDEVGS